MIEQMRRTLLGLIALVFIAGSAAVIYFEYPWRDAGTRYPTAEEHDPYVRFAMEAYDSIRQNYWRQSDDAGLSGLFELSLEKASNASSSVAATDRASTARMLAAVYASLPSDSAKQDLALQLLRVVLYNLAPQGRDELLSSQGVTDLRDRENNVNPSADLYGELGVQASSSPAQIDAAYAAARARLTASSSPQAAQQLARAQYVHDVLTNARSRAQYDATGAEPTVFPHVFGTTLYLAVAKMSPTTAQEFADALDAASSTPLSSMVIDLRGNVGGSLDLAPVFIGLFVGQNEYTFDLFHQGDYQVQRSPVGKFAGLSRFGEIAVLTDHMTQSTAEVFAAAMKRFHLATVVGTTTRGWGSVENTYPISTQLSTSTRYALLLVNSLTVNDTGQPIEGNGVAPDVDTSTPGWEAKLPQHFRSQGLISAVERAIAQPPLQ
jgi:hypothetical protein